MSLFNDSAKEIHCKILYWGPSLGGKTTNIQWVYHKTASDQKSKLMALNTENERTLFFDFLPLYVGDVRGFKTKFHLYTVPGQVVYDNSRRLIMKGVDGIIFVADSQSSRLEENIQSFDNLEINLNKQGYDIREIPLIIQYNKRDLSNITPLAELRKHLNRYSSPEFEAIATRGVGVFDSLMTVSRSILNILKGGQL